METVTVMFLQVTAMLFTVAGFFVLGAAFGAGAWTAWRALERRAGRVKNSE